MLKLQANNYGGNGIGMISGNGQTITANRIELNAGNVGQNNGVRIGNFSSSDQEITCKSDSVESRWFGR